MSAAFELALAQTLGFEGGVADSKIDRGGLTYRGITQKLYNAWRRTTGQAQQPVTLATDAEIRAIAQDEFWERCRCDELPPALAIAVFDMAFNSSPYDAKIALQTALGVKRDGVVGAKTLAAARAAGPDVVLRFLKARGAELQQIIIHDRIQVGNLEGWIDRLLDQAWKGGKP